MAGSTHPGQGTRASALDGLVRKVGGWAEDEMGDDLNDLVLVGHGYSMKQGIGPRLEGERRFCFILSF